MPYQIYLLKIAIEYIIIHTTSSTGGINTVNTLIHIGIKNPV